jgi:hypothetical protein
MTGRKRAPPEHRACDREVDVDSALQSCLLSGLSLPIACVLFPQSVDGKRSGHPGRAQGSRQRVKPVSRKGYFLGQQLPLF